MLSKNDSVVTIRGREKGVRVTPFIPFWTLPLLLLIWGFRLYPKEVAVFPSARKIH